MSLDALTLKETRPMKVSELVQKLKADVEKNHNNIKVVGEVSSFKQWRSGHCYFDIKDEGATLAAVIFAPHFARLGFKVTDGQQMLFSGRVSIYQANSRLQMMVTNMEPLGQGALALAFEQLKARLLAEGLFEPAHKKPIRPFNFSVGVITSSHGAVLRDMVRILKGRLPSVHILFCSVRVQGVGAAIEIKNALELLDSSGACDVIIVGRGGGSLEDLQAFNDEALARAIFKAKTPIISAVGHETDFSICDFVADKRAATPTHAASLAVPILSELKDTLSHFKESLRAKQMAKIQKISLELALEKRKLKDPRILLFRHWQEVDERSKRLLDSFKRLIFLKKHELDKYKARLEPLSPHVQLRMKRESFYDAKLRLERLNPNYKLKLLRTNFLSMMEKLDALSPLRVLGRGYSLIESKNGQILSKKAQFSLNQTINIRLEDGQAKALITELE